MKTMNDFFASIEAMQNASPNQMKKVMNIVEGRRSQPRHHLVNFLEIQENIKHLPLYLKNLAEEGLKYMKDSELPYFMGDVYLSTLKIHELQRELEPRHVFDIAINFNDYLTNPLIIHMDSKTGDMFVDDGQHLWIALMLLGYKKWPAQIFIDTPIQKRGEIFTKQSSKRRGINPTAKFHAECVCGNGNGRTFKEIAKQYGVTICEKNKKVRNITSLRVLEAIYKQYGEKGIHFALNVIGETCFASEESGYVEALMNIGRYSYKYCLENPRNYDILINHLRQFHTIAEFYADVVAESTRTPDGKEKYAISAKHPESGIRHYIDNLFSAFED